MLVVLVVEGVSMKFELEVKLWQHLQHANGHRYEYIKCDLLFIHTQINPTKYKLLVSYIKEQRMVT